MLEYIGSAYRYLPSHVKNGIVILLLCIFESIILTDSACASCTKIENTMFMSSDMKFIRRDQKTYRNGEALPSHSEFSGQLCDVASRSLTCYGDVI